MARRINRDKPVVAEGNSHTDAARKLITDLSRGTHLGRDACYEPSY
eukprot:CAMPEP_0113704058 /NCGR_PEP_ID=MMETSP0038_2-20120614/26280_1 /TAXON_ID=2898 /ORGANISM="Cryptomonas paramecium" /LENGTH=45 /DNA_ID=CAMNT_0000628741 /DNA_START=41 /DNA_END=175 /DNA_ORIENTATION=- /assembly_acc=CAM_ASM_000170